jgi:hypothetical protein
MLPHTHITRRYGKRLARMSAFQNSHTIHLAHSPTSPFHLVRLVAFPEAEAGREITAEQLFLLDVGQQSLIDGLLVAGTRAGNPLFLFALSISTLPKTPQVLPANQKF